MSRWAAVSDLSALVAAIPVLVLCFMLGCWRKPGGWRRSPRSASPSSWRSWRMACRCGLAVMSAITGAAYGLFPDRVDRLRVDHAVPPGGRHRQVRDHQGLGRRADQRSPPAGAVHRVLVRRVHRGRRRLRRAGRRVRRDARRSRVLAVLCGGHLPDRQHRRPSRSGRSAFRSRRSPALPDCRCSRSAPWSADCAR